MTTTQVSRQRYEKLLRTILISGGALLINSLTAFLLVPVISNTVGTEAYGFVSMAKNFEQYAMMLTAALNAFAARYITIAYHENKLEEANTYFSSTFYGDSILSTVLFFLAMVGIFYLDHFVHISPQLVTDVKLLFTFIFVNFWLTTMTTAFSSTAHVKNKLDIAGIFKVLAYAAEAGLLIFCFTVLRSSVYYVGLGRALQAGILAVGSLWIWRRYAGELKVHRKHFSWRAIRQLLSNGIWTSMNSLGGVLNDGLDLWICNLMLNPLQMGQLALAKTFHSLFGGVFSMISQAFEPSLLKSYATGDHKTLLEELGLGMKLSGMLSNILFAGFVALGVPFYRLWIPREDVMLIYGLTIVNNMAIIPSGPMFPLYYIYVLTAKNRFPTMMTIVSGVFNVLCMFLLLRFTDIGMYGIIWTTVVAVSIIDLISNPLYMAHVLQKPWWTFYPGLIKNLVSCVLMTAVFYGFSRLYQPSSWIMLILCAAALFVLGAAMQMLIVFNRKDWKKLFRLLRRSEPTV